MQERELKRGGLPTWLKVSIAGGVCLILVMCWFLFCIRSAKPDAGHEVVLVEKPIIFGDGGVNPDPVSTGRQYVMWTTQRVDVNMQPMQFTIHFDDLMSSDGVPLDFDSVIRLRVIDSVSLIKNFGPEWYKNNVQAEFRNRARQAVRKHGMNETAIDTSAIEAIDDEISTEMVAYIKSADLPIELIDITVGKANPPDSIKDQRVATAAQQQRVITERERDLAEKSRKAAEESRALADNAYRNAMDMTPELFVELQRIEMMGRACSPIKNDAGVLQAVGCTFIIGETSAQPVIPIR
jgi:regulator of protease activity HflC (stomatin/prohibitin superfamily)